MKCISYTAEEEKAIIAFMESAIKEGSCLPTGTPSKLSENSLGTDYTKNDDKMQVTQAPDLYPDKNKLRHDILGDYLLEKMHAANINNILHVYNDGIYSPDTALIEREIIRLDPRINTYLRGETLAYMKLKCNTVKTPSPARYITFKSKIYDIEADQFIDYSPEYVFFEKTPFDYNPNAEEQLAITNLISQIADHDKDIINLLYEAIGYSFYRACPIRGALILYGVSGNNGKSTFLNLITRLIGAENTSHLSLQDTEDRFRLAEIVGKLANIGDDIPSRYLSDSSIFKKLVTGEPLTAEYKHQKPFPFKNHAKLFFACNSLPRISDNTEALKSRIHIIPLNHDFSKDKSMDHSLKDRVWTDKEMEYLLKLAMDGLKRLLKNGHFTASEAVKSALNSFEVSNNPVLNFIQENEPFPNETTNTVYALYSKWCSDNGFKILSKSAFVREIKQCIPDIEVEVRKIEGKSVRCFSDYINPFV